jgi:hypothetical protein
MAIRSARAQIVTLPAKMSLRFITLNGHHGSKILYKR